MVTTMIICSSLAICFPRSCAREFSSQDANHCIEDLCAFLARPTVHAVVLRRRLEAGNFKFPLGEGALRALELDLNLSLFIDQTY